MNKHAFFESMVCLVLLGGFLAHQHQDAQIKACQEDIAGLRRWLDDKFPPPKWKQKLAMENVLDVGRQLYESTKDIRPEDRTQFSFAVSDFANSYGQRVPKWLGNAVKSVTGQDICEPSLKLGYISQFYAILSANVDQLDSESEQDFLVVGKPYWSSFPLLLNNYLNNVVRRKLSYMNDSEPSPTPP
jgi:hypothetical protein